MRIHHKTYQSNRDFKAVYECEHCGGQQEGDGYGDAFFLYNIIPNMTCASCGKSSLDAPARVAN